MGPFTATCHCLLFPTAHHPGILGSTKKYDVVKVPPIFTCGENARTFRTHRSKGNKLCGIW